MLRGAKYFSQRVLFGLILVSALPPSLSAAPFQGGRGQNIPGDIESQRTQNSEQTQQLQQQQQQELSLRHPVDQLDRLDWIFFRMEYERSRLKQLLRANFRRHYKVIRQNAEELVQLTSNLQANLAHSGDPELSRTMIAQTERMQKLAHTIRVSMADRRLPKAKAALPPARTPGVTPPVDGKDLLKANAADANTGAARLRNAVEDYLASDNEHTVSVAGLRNAADKQHFDPNSLEILKRSFQLEQLAQQIRSELRALNPR